MTIEIHELKAGLRVRGLVAAGDVTIVAVEAHGECIVNVVYRGDDGQIADRLLTLDDLAKIEMATGRRWTFDADGAAFKLASEARRIQLAHLFDPFAAVGSSTIEPLPHQIEAVYGRLLPLQPLRFLLADDPGAGKTIMSGLYIRELMLRGDLDRCLVIAPGSLVEQWQEELDDKFDLRFDILSRDMVEAARTRQPVPGAQPADRPARPAVSQRGPPSEARRSPTGISSSSTRRTRCRPASTATR